MAFAIVDYAGENYEDNKKRELSDYLKISIWQTFFSETGEQKDDKELSFHKCSDEELGLVSGETQSKINPISSSDLETVKLFKHLFYCFDQSEVELLNDAAASEYSGLDIEMNIPEYQCENDLDEALICDPGTEYWYDLSEKWITVLMNERRFLSDNYSAKTPVLKESVLSWMRFPHRALEKEYKVKETALFREDSLFMAVNGITQIEDEAFEVVHTEDFYPIPRTPTELISLSYYVDRDLEKVERAVYNTFMLLGDVGGL